MIEIKLQESLSFGFRTYETIGGWSTGIQSGTSWAYFLIIHNNYICTDFKELYIKDFFSKSTSSSFGYSINFSLADIAFKSLKISFFIMFKFFYYNVSKF